MLVSRGGGWVNSTITSAMLFVGLDMFRKNNVEMKDHVCHIKGRVDDIEIDEGGRGSWAGNSGLHILCRRPSKTMSMKMFVNDATFERGNKTNANTWV